jgi:iron complex transport system substrate-binding protein
LSPARTGGEEDVVRFPTRLLLVLALVATTACGSGSDDSEPKAGASPTTQDQFPVTIEAANGPVTIPEQPTAIVSLSPTATEMLFAIDAGAQVIAADDNSDYPTNAPTTDLSGFEPNVEAVASYEPDLVVLSNDPAEVTKALGKLDIPVLLQPAAATLDDTYAQVEQLGTATGHVDDAAAAVASMETEIAAIVAKAPSFVRAPTYYHELDDVYFTVTSDTFIGQIYSLLGLENIADAAKGAGSGYPQLSAEYIVESNPDIIFLADTKCCDQSLDSVGKRPGWDQITAVKTGAVVELDDDIASRWGPRVVDYLRTVAEALGGLES